MIKGVNKTIIEVSDTGSDCFERAILFVRPGRSRNGNEDITERARDYMASLKLRRGFYRSRIRGFVLTALISALAGSALTVAFFLLL
ncbi:hypothetical protein LJC63_09480 [Ruminococcaceae bacterium OttesenSCG-928-L11]|nr:hypothetical protein [Ruminococcaceae bacterium OttesenSCG-928-L11]